MRCAALPCLAALLWPLAVPAAPAAPLPAAEPAASAAGVAEPQVLHQVTEDEHVRIEELRVRGQTRRLTVQPKIKGLGPYEILPPEPGRDPAQDPKAGKRVVFSLSF